MCFFFGVCAFVFFCFPSFGEKQEDITNTYDVFITVVFVFGVIGIFGAGTIRYRMGFAGDVTIFQVRFDLFLFRFAFFVFLFLFLFLFFFYQR